MYESHCNSSEWFVYENFCLSISKSEYTWKDAEKYCKSQSVLVVVISYHFKTKKFVFTTIIAYPLKLKIKSKNLK
jgi:hypothetical protein